MIISSTDHHPYGSRTRVHRVPAVVCAKSDQITGEHPTLPIMARVTASHAHQLHRDVLTSHGSACFSTLLSGSHVIQSP
jgi:hypothetical protein